MTSADRVATPDLVDHEPQAAPPLATPAHQAIPHPGGLRRAPDLIGLDALDAGAIARDVGLPLSVTIWETTIGPWGLVLDQQPAPGARVRRGGSVRIVVSGRPYVPLPDVRGLPMGAAIEQLSWLGFVPIVDSRQVSSSLPAGHVIAIRPAAGTLAVPGSVVALTLARTEGEVAPRSPRRRPERR